MKQKKKKQSRGGCFSPIAVVLASIIALTPFFYSVWLEYTSDEWIVILYSMKTKEAAIAKAKAIRLKGYPAEVYESRNGYFAVTLGAHPKEVARDLQIKVIRNRIGSIDTFLGSPQKFLIKVFPLEPYQEL